MDPQPISGSSLSGIKRSAPSEADKISHTLSLPASCCFSPPKVEILPFKLFFHRLFLVMILRTIQALHTE